MRRVIPLILAATLAACGANGPPEPPAGALPGITVEGRVEVGITGGR